jgi:hypothetical protein
MDTARRARACRLRLQLRRPLCSVPGEAFGVAGTRASIQKSLLKKMGCRVKPGNDE